MTRTDDLPDPGHECPGADCEPCAKAAGVILPLIVRYEVYRCLPGEL